MTGFATPPQPVPVGIYPGAPSFYGTAQGPNYNVTPSSMAPIRDAASQWQTKLVPHSVFGDSLSSGYQVAGAEQPTNAWPGWMRQVFTAAPLAWADGGSIVASADAQFWPQWTWPAAWSNFGAFYGSNAAGVATYVSTDKGTVAVVAYLDIGASFSWQVDAGGAINVVTTGTNTIKLSTSGVLANAVHTITITAAAAGVYIAGAGVIEAAGMMFNNFAQTASGVLAGYGGSLVGAAGAWSVFTPNTVGSLRVGMHNDLVTSTGAKGLVGLCIGSNDICVGLATPAAVIAGYELLIAGVTNSAFYVVAQFRQPSVTDATWNQWIGALQAFCVKHNFPLFDWNARVGGYSAALAAGILQSDAVHPAAACSQTIGQAVPLEIAA